MPSLMVAPPIEAYTTEALTAMYAEWQRFQHLVNLGGPTAQVARVPQTPFTFNQILFELLCRDAVAEDKPLPPSLDD